MNEEEGYVEEPFVEFGAVGFRWFILGICSVGRFGWAKVSVERAELEF